MSGNSDGSQAALAALQQANNVPAKTPPWMKGVTPNTLPQAMPGQLEAIAAQLAQGFSAPNPAAQTAGRAAYLKHLDQVYEPVRSLNFNAPPNVPPKPPVVPPKPPVAPVAPPPRPTSPLQWDTGMARQDERGNWIQVMSPYSIGHNNR